VDREVRCATRRSKRRVLPEDLRFELTQLLARLDPQLVEVGTRHAVRLERLGLPTGAVQREHQLPARPLTMRMLRDHCLELADQLRMTTEPEIRVDPLLDRAQSQRLQPAALDPRERLLEFSQRRPAPQPERLAQQLRSAATVRLARLGEQALETEEIDG